MTSTISDSQGDLAHCSGDGRRDGAGLCGEYHVRPAWSCAERAGFTVDSGASWRATGTVEIGTFVDSNPNLSADDFTALIEWGDGTVSSGTVYGGTSAFFVYSNHYYAQPGVYDMKLIVAARDGGATVADGGSSSNPRASLPVQVTVSGINGVATVGEAFSGTIATFTDSDVGDQASDWTATLDGDGTLTVTGSRRPFRRERRRPDLFVTRELHIAI